MLWKTLLGAAGLYGARAGEAAVIHSFCSPVKTPAQPHAAVQVFDFEGGFCCNTGFPEFDPEFLGSQVRVPNQLKPPGVRQAALTQEPS